MKTSHPAYDRGIVAEPAVAVNFAPVGEHAFDIVEGLRSLGMPGQFRFLPGGLERLRLLPQDVDAILKFREPAKSLLILPSGSLDQRHLLLDLLQLLLRLLRCFHG